MRKGYIKIVEGFSLVELIVAMAIFVTVIMVTTTTFTTILTKGSQQAKSTETQIEGIVGLELLRADLQQAGFGLPWSYQSPITFREYVGDASSKEAIMSLNDGGLNNPALAPRAVFSVNGENSAGINGSDYLTIKSTVVGMNTASKKWTYMHYSSTGSKEKQWDGKANFQRSDRVIVIKMSILNHDIRKELVVNGSFYVKSSLLSTFVPINSKETYLVYGVDTDTDLTMPFNRADYYIKAPTKADKSCAQGTGTLYKATVNHKNGAHNSEPLLDCIADMQVVYSLDTNSDGLVDLHDDASLSTLGATPSAELIRACVKEIRVYIVVQEGKKDMAYNYPEPSLYVGEYGMGRELIIGRDWRNYRWKLYTIVVSPRNLN